MTISEKNANINKIDTKEELKELLKKHEFMFSCYMLDYLNSLIELKCSAIDYFGSGYFYSSPNEVKILSELEVYRKIVKYNIYNRALYLFYVSRPLYISIPQYDFEISKKDDLGNLGFSISINDRDVKLFDFDYNECLNCSDSEDKTMKIGNISLYQTLESKELREAELNRIMSELESLYDEHNPYSKYGKYGIGRATDWEYHHKLKEEALEKKFTELDNKKELSYEDRKEIEITDEINSMLLREYGLKREDFEEEKNTDKKSKLKKKLVLNRPNITIANYIKYI